MRRALALLAFSGLAFSPATALAHGAETHDLGSTYMAPRSSAGNHANEAPADVELEMEKLAAERTAAVARNAPGSEMARLDQRKAHLALRHRIASLRLDRDRAREAGKTDEVKRLDRAIHEAKQKLGRSGRPERR